MRPKMQFDLEQKTALFPDIDGECHASTLARLRSGGFAVAWFQGSKEGRGDVAIYGTRRDAAGSWEAPRPWAKVNGLPHWNPVLFSPDGQNLTLFFKVGGRCDQWQTWVQHSSDLGRNWSPPTELVPGAENARGPVKNKPIRLSDGSILAGNSREDQRKWRVFTDRSTDGGKSWTASAEIPQEHAKDDLGVIQPTLWESAPGRVHMLVRSSSDLIWRSDSRDYGRTWAPLYPTTLPNNNSGIDLAKGDDALVLAFNNTSGNWTVRTPLTLAASRDNGQSWQSLLDLETADGEYSYPAVIPLGGGRFAGTYTNRRKTITFWLGMLRP